jgi:vesicle-fusing ATPase
MRSNGLINDDVDIDNLAKITKNYTGAEIEAVCRSATSFALFKDLDLSTIGQSNPKDPKSQASNKKISSRTADTSQSNNLGELDKKVLMADFL